MSEVRRLQFDFAEGAAKRLEEMQKEMGLDTPAEVVRRALFCLDMIRDNATSLTAELYDDLQKECVLPKL